MDKKFCPYCMNPVKEGETCKICGLTEGVYTPRDHHLPLGSVLNDRYLIGRVLGEGGFGITYIGCDLNLEMKVAIKEYFPIDRVYRFSKASLDVSNYAHAAEKFHSGKVKFLREARTMARLDKQQNIVSVRDFFEKNNTAYIVMEYVEGTTLKELVHQRGGRISAGELLYMLEPLFPALTSVHELGLIHRDISPDNLMLENGKIKLLDFGCARESASQSETMTIALKQGYAPLEQYQHKGQGAWTDVYALSATIYYCLTGKTPQSAVDRLNEEELVPPRRLGVDLTADQEAALLKGMNVRAKDRFQSVEELFAALYTNALTVPTSAEHAMAESTQRKTTATAPTSEKSIQEEPVSTETLKGLTPDVSVSEKNSGVEESIRNAVTDSSGTTNSAEASPSPETDRGQNQSAKERIIALLNAFKQQLKDRNPVVILACCAVMLVAVICVAWIVIPSKGDTELPVNAGVPSTPTDDPQPGNQGDPVKEPEIDEPLFANAVTLEELSISSLQMLMNDETVPAIRIPEGLTEGSMEGVITITKPVLIEKNVYLSLCDPITVQGENASLWIEGEVASNSMIRTADGGRIVAASQDCIWSEFFWLEKEEDVQILNGEKQDYTDLIIGGKDTLFQNAVKVSDEDTLRRAVDAQKAVIICEDMTITSFLTSAASIMIEEGVTVSWQEGLTMTKEGTFLWNEGTIQSGILAAFSGTGIINYGELINSNDFILNSVLVNMGELGIQNNCFYEEDKHGRICNMGILRFSGNSSSIDLINSGTITVCTDDSDAGWFNFRPGGEVVNYGELRIEGGNVIVGAFIKNMSDGRLTVCDNATLFNDGIIEMYSGELVCEPKGILNNVNGAIYYYFLTPKDYSEAGWIHYTNVINPLDAPRISQVSDFDALCDALQDPQVDKICVTGTVSWDAKEPLILTKEMEISENAELLMTGGYELVLDGCFLQNSGYIKVDNLTLIHGSSLRNFYGTIELDTPDSIIKMGNAQGERGYDNSDCIMNENGRILHSGEMELYDNALIIQKGYLEESSIRILGNAFVCNMGEIQWRDGGILEISEGGQFHNAATQEWHQDLSISISKNCLFYNFSSLTVDKGSLNIAFEGVFESLDGYLTFGNEFSVYNSGRMTFSMGRDSTQLQGYLENNGMMLITGITGFVINAPVEAANPARLNNKGELYLDSEAYIRTLNGEFIGNEAVYTGS